MPPVALTLRSARNCSADLEVSTRTSCRPQGRRYLQKGTYDGGIAKINGCGILKRSIAKTIHSIHVRTFRQQCPHRFRMVVKHCPM